MDEIYITPQNTIDEACSHGRQRMERRRKNNVSLVRFSTWTPGQKIYVVAGIVFIVLWIIFGSNG